MDAGQGMSARAGVQARATAGRALPQGFRPPPLHDRHGQLARRRPAGKVGGPGKRLFDIVASAGALVMLSPILAGIWLIVRLESPGPGLFRQRRGGFQGRPFYIYKFRTMRTCESRTIAQATQADGRTTRLGRFLRKYSIDELPQLINVLKGDMSIVGPRPHALAHDRQFCTVDRRYAGRHHARPGITGLAQVSGLRGPTDTREKIVQRMEYDLRYVANWSWAMDLGIILRTVLVLIRDRNAF
jgi:lipopolysaccharide/colanic/teichoic acid biosynthesis glycosyltransferase